MSAAKPAGPAPEPIHEVAGTGLTVHGVLHRPATPASEGLVLTHGAGSSAESPLLVALAEALAARGVLVLRCDLPFRQARAQGPPSPAGAARDRDGLRAAISALTRRGVQRVSLGGHSYGGRQATLLAAEDPGTAEALFLLAYPLHPPTRPAELRVSHFPRLRMPAVFVHGTEDPFGTEAELRGALTLIPAPVTLHLEPGAGHDLGAARRAHGALASLATRLAARWIERAP